MKKIFYIILILFLSLNALASENDFSVLKSRMDNNSLPLVNITVNMDNMSKQEYTDGNIEIAEPQDNPGDTKNTLYSCKVKYRGSSSLRYDKKSFAVKLYDENGKSLDADIMGIRNTNKWILDAMAIDHIRMRNRVLFDIWNEYSKTPYDTDYDRRNGTKGQFVEVFINGNYHGLYCLTDKIDRKLLGLKKPKEQADGSVSMRGLLYKCNAWCDAAFLAGYDDEPMNKEEWNHWELQEPDDYPSVAAWTPLKNLIDFCYTSDKTDFATNYKEHFYKDNLIDYALLVLAFNISDNVLKNAFLSTVNIEDGQQFLFTPWDLDSSLGSAWNGELGKTLPSLALVFNWARPYYRLDKENVDNFIPDMREKWMQLRNGSLSRENVQDKIDSYARRFMLSGAWQREYGKWNNNPVALEENLQNGTEFVKDYYNRNFDNITSLLNQASGIEANTADDADDAAIYNTSGILLYRGNAKSMNIRQRPDGSFRKQAKKNVIITNARPVIR